MVDDNGTFICANGGCCRASAVDRGFGFAAGQLSYVGDAYACHVDGAPLRILVVSMQVGDREAPVTMVRRAEQISGVVGGKRNPHMRGVIRAVQLLHGLDLDNEHLSGDTHVLRAYSMANSVLCSALPTNGESRRGEPTKAMLQNCSEHLSRTVGALEPTIVHTQGAGTLVAIESITGLITRHSPEVATIEHGDRTMVLCSTSHPAAGPPSSWSSVKQGTYFTNIVVPAMRLARQVALGI